MRHLFLGTLTLKEYLMEMLYFHFNVQNKCYLFPTYLKAKIDQECLLLLKVLTLSSDSWNYFCGPAWEEERVILVFWNTNCLCPIPSCFLQFFSQFRDVLTLVHNQLEFPALIFSVPSHVCVCGVGESRLLQETEQRRSEKRKSTMPFPDMAETWLCSA